MLCVLLSAFSCRKKTDIANWDTDLVAPIAQGSVNLADLLTNDELTADNSGLLRVKLRDTLFRVGLDSLIGIPDTTFSDEFVIPIGNVQWPPGVPFYDSTTITRYNLKQVQLTYATVRSSLFTVKLRNTTRTQILAIYTIPSATDANGDTFRLERLIPAKTTLEEDFNLDGYNLDLRGRGQNSFNTLISEVVAMIDPAQTSNYTFKAGEGFRIENTFKKIIPQYARGYFGSENINFRDSTAFDLLNDIRFTALDISEFDVSLTINNGVGADLGFKIDELESYNDASGITSNLQHSIIGQNQFFGRAIDLVEPANPVKYISKTFEFNDENSNLDELIELKPSGLIFDLDLKINPLGNISLGNDFVYYGHDLSLYVDVDIPVKIGLEGLVLQDTFAFTLEEENPEKGADRINSGFLKLDLDNEYPLAARVQLYVEDENRALLDSLLPAPQTIEATMVDANNRAIGSAQSLIEIPVNQEVVNLLRAGSFIRFKAIIDTYNKQVVNIYDDHSIRFKLVGDLNVNVQ